MENLKITAEPVKHTDIRKKETYYVKLTVEGKDEEFINIGATTYAKLCDLQTPIDKGPELPFGDNENVNNEQQVLQNSNDVRGRRNGRNTGTQGD